MGLGNQLFRGSLWQRTVAILFNNLGIFSDYTPTLGASGGTFTSTSIQWARYFEINNFVFGYVRFTGTAGSTADYLTFTLPVEAEKPSSQPVLAIIGGLGIVYAYSANATPDVVRVFGGPSSGTGVPNGSTVVYALFAYEKAN